MITTSTTTPETSLTRQEMVPDTILRELAEGDPMRAMGTISEEHQAMLAMYLPEICGELLAHRRAAEAQAPAPSRLPSFLRRAAAWIGAVPAAA